MTALLALHIESALDSTKTELVRSMARISISQTMLVLTQGKDIPVLKRALPIFKEILTRRSLHLVPQLQPQDSSMADENASPHLDTSLLLSQLEQDENNTLFDVNLLGFDFLDEWQIGQLDFTGRY
jgi:hypothetical protein